MKQFLFLLLSAGLLLGSGCTPDAYPLELQSFDVYWNDYDQSGTRTPADDLEFVVSINTTDPNPQRQFITEWELNYYVNGNFGGTLQGDEGIASNNLNINADIVIEFLNYPGPGQFKPGDQLEFVFWAIDNHGTELQRSYNFRLE